MREIKLTGRELTLMRILDFTGETPGEEALAATRLPLEDFVDVLNGLLETGFLETEPYRDQITAEEVPSIKIAVNGSYAHELREAMIRRF